MTPYVIEREGRVAFDMGASANDCPYTFDKSQFWSRKDYKGFEAVRWKMDAWMNGWIDEQKKTRGVVERTAKP